MRTIEKTLNLFTLAELREEHPEAFARLADEHAQSIYDAANIHTEGISESLLATLAAFGAKLDNWGNAIVRGDHGELSGARALAWVENNVLSPRRIPWTGQERARLAQFGAFYRPGMVKPCPFTGICYDHDFLDAITTDLSRGVSLSDAVGDLPRLADSIGERELEWQAHETQFLEWGEDGTLFDEDGNRYNPEGTRLD